MNTVALIGIALAIIFYSLAALIRRKKTAPSRREKTLVIVLAALATLILAGAFVYWLTGGR